MVMSYLKYAILITMKDIESEMYSIALCLFITESHKYTSMIHSKHINIDFFKSLIIVVRKYMVALQKKLCP